MSDPRQQRFYREPVSPRGLFLIVLLVTACGALLHATALLVVQQVQFIWR